MKLKIYLDDDEGGQVGHLKLSGYKLSSFGSAIVGFFIWLCRKV